MNILMLFSTDIPPCEGIASHVIGLAKRLKQRGHRVVFMTRSNRRQSAEFEYEGFRVIKVPFYPLYPFHIYCHRYFVAKAIAALSPAPDLVHLHSPLVPPLPKKWPIITTFHTPMVIDAAKVENVSLKTLAIKLMARTTSYWVEKKLLAISDLVMTVSPQVADELRTFYKYSKDICLTPSIIDTDFYKPAAANPGQKNLLYLGRLGYRKGLFELVESAKIVIKDFPKAKYIIVGSGPLENKIKSLVSRYGLGQNFQFCREVRNRGRILQYYQDAYAVLIPSYYEGLPMVLLEAMACGKTIIATNVGFSREILEDGINAILIEPKSAGDLAQATKRLLSSEQLCRDLAKAARQAAVEMADFEKSTDKVEEAYQLAIKKAKIGKK